MKLEPNETLDLRGIPCPQNAARALITLETMGSGELLLIFVDNGEPLENLLRSMETNGHSVKDRAQSSQDEWKVWIQAS